VVTSAFPARGTVKKDRKKEEQPPRDKERGKDGDKQGKGDMHVMVVGTSKVLRPHPLSDAHASKGRTTHKGGKTTHSSGIDAVRQSADAAIGGLADLPEKGENSSSARPLSQTSFLPLTATEQQQQVEEEEVTVNANNWMGSGVGMGAAMDSTQLKSMVFPYRVKDKVGAAAESAAQESKKEGKKEDKKDERTSTARSLKSTKGKGKLAVAGRTLKGKTGLVAVKERDKRNSGSTTRDELLQEAKEKEREKEKKDDKKLPMPSAQIKRTLTGVISAPIRCAAVVRRFDSVWTGQRDGCITIFRASTGEVIDDEVRVQEQSLIMAMELCKRNVWVGTETGRLVLFNAKTREQVSEARQHSGGINCIACNNVGVFTGSSDFTVIQWTFEGKFQKLFSGHTGGVKAMLCLGSADLWTAGDDHSIRIWNVHTTSCTKILTGHTGAVRCLVTTGLAVWSGSEDGTIRAWNLTEGDCINVINVDKSVTGLVQMGKHVWSCGMEPQIHIWNRKSMTLANTLRPKGHKRYINALVKVSSVLTRNLWSYSLVDGKLCMWKAESTYDTDLMEEESAQLRASNRVLEKAYRQAVGHSVQLSSLLQEERSVVQNEMEWLVSQLASTDRTKSLRDQVTRLLTSLHKVEQEKQQAVDQLRMQQRVARDVQQSLEEQRKLQMTSVVSLQTALSRRTEEITSLKAKYKDLRTSTKRITREAEKAMVEHQKLELAIEEKTQEFRSLEKINDELQADLDSSYIAHGRLQGEAEALREELADIHANYRKEVANSELLDRELEKEKRERKLERKREYEKHSELQMQIRELKQKLSQMSQDAGSRDSASSEDVSRKTKGRKSSHSSSDTSSLRRSAVFPSSSGHRKDKNKGSVSMSCSAIQISSPASPKDTISSVATSHSMSVSKSPNPMFSFPDGGNLTSGLTEQIESLRKQAEADEHESENVDHTLFSDLPTPSKSNRKRRNRSRGRKKQGNGAVNSSGTRDLTALTSDNKQFEQMLPPIVDTAPVVDSAPAQEAELNLAAVSTSNGSVSDAFGSGDNKEDKQAKSDDSVDLSLELNNFAPDGGSSALTANHRSSKIVPNPPSTPNGAFAPGSEEASNKKRRKRKKKKRGSEKDNHS